MKWEHDALGDENQEVLATKKWSSGGWNGMHLALERRRIDDWTEEQEEERWFNGQRPVEYSRAEGRKLGKKSAKFIQNYFLDFLRRNRHEFCGQLGDHVVRIREEAFAMLDRVMDELGLPRDETYEGRKTLWDLALHEAHRNGQIHGNLRDPNRKVFTTLTVTRDIHGKVFAIFEIEDSGEGFDVSRIPDPTNGANLEAEVGRGLCLMRSLFDDVSFNAKGNCVRLRKNLGTTPQTSLTAPSSALDSHLSGDRIPEVQPADR